MTPKFETADFFSFAFANIEGAAAIPSASTATAARDTDLIALPLISSCKLIFIGQSS
jgi:hypothetical protein